MHEHSRTLLIGWRGGVGTAAQGLLTTHPRGRELAAETRLFLLDAEPPHGPPFAPLVDAEVLPPQKLCSGEDLEAVIARCRIDRVIDLGTSNTLASVRACARARADYLSTCYDPLTYPASGPPEGPPLMEGARALLPAARPAIETGSHLIASGMNPGVVSALLLRGLERFAELAGVGEHELDIHAIVLTEIDTTHALEGAPAADVFAMSWSPEHCLSEILEPSASIVRGGEITPLGHPPIAARYRARCGEDVALGFAVPHEELVWLGARFPRCELSYVYQLPAAAEAALRAHPQRSAEDWETARLIPPRIDARALEGFDRMGVLLCSRRFGELWMGFHTTMAEAQRFETSATELQVAAGVLAGWAQLGERAGIHLVEELDWRRFLRDAEAILGPATEVWDPDAPPRLLADRQVC